jgi:hypothetical protein
MSICVDAFEPSNLELESLIANHENKEHREYQSN